LRYQQIAFLNLGLIIDCFRLFFPIIYPPLEEVKINH